MSWRTAKSLDVLLGEINDLAPDRSKASDGSIGDTSHQASYSDHNPNDDGVVCARDFTHDPEAGADMGAISRFLVAHPHRCLKYVIFNRRIALRSNSFRWQPYYGSNPHTHHMHVSVGRGPDGDSRQPYDDTTPWGLKELAEVNLDDKLPVSDYWKEIFAYDEEVQDGITVLTALRSGYFHSRDARAKVYEALARLDALEGEIKAPRPVELSTDDLAKLAGLVADQLAGVLADRLEA